MNEASFSDDKHNLVLYFEQFDLFVKKIRNEGENDWKLGLGVWKFEGEVRIFERDVTRFG